jgi:hypothetical protein
MNKEDRKLAEYLRKVDFNNLPGAYRGIVESIDDPDRLGRAKIRIWSIHGDDDCTPTNALPWAEVAEDSGGGYDHGSFKPPKVGSSVWIMFENCMADYPVIFGTSRGVPLRDVNNPNIHLTKDGLPRVETPWLPPDGALETPLEIFEDVYAGDPHPTREVWQKSYKGHTIYIEDADGSEFLRIIDRAGQIIEMDCPVDSIKQAGNLIQRGLRNSTRGDQLPHEVMVNSSARIRMVDLSGQEIVMDATSMTENITIRSICKQTGNEQKIVLSSGKSKESIELSDYMGNHITINPNIVTPIILEDSSGNKIVFNKETGKISIVGIQGTEEIVKQKAITTEGTYTETVGGDLVSNIANNCKTNIGNDNCVGVIGSNNLTVGGSLSIVVTNAPVGIPSVPSVTPFKIQVTSGGINIEADNMIPIPLSNIKIANKLPGSLALSDLNYLTLDSITGEIELHTVMGNATLSTLLGNVLCGTNLGNVTLQTSAGIATLKTVLGIANVDGTTIQLGSIPCTQGAIRGTVFIGLLASVLALLKAYLLLPTQVSLIDTSNVAIPPLLAAIALLDASFIPGTPLSSLSAKILLE